MRSLIATMLLLLAAPALAGETKDARVQVAAAMDRGLDFLAQDAVAWKKEHNCASCHHAALVVWSMHEAQNRGHEVDVPLLAELKKWLAEAGSGKTSLPRPEAAPQAYNAKALWFAMALNADPAPEAAVKDGLQSLLATVKEDQTENGSWSAWPETRPPIFGPSDETVTAMAALSLLPAAAVGDASAVAARDRAVQWLTATNSDDELQSISMRLVLWRRLKRPEEEWRPLVTNIKTRQEAGGGWRQSPEIASDAWATGQALYALAHAGLDAGDPAIQRGQDFLVRTQREDGSWPMMSRPSKPGDEGASSLIPITGAGTAWGVIGLARSLPALRE